MTKTFLTHLIRDERGTSAIEMGLICALIVIAMMGALQGFANESTLTWTTISNKVQAANDAN
jgi:pilus assembly protein Flp/PilA